MRGLGRTTGEHAMLGTPSYMSPEQAQGQTDLIGPSTDVWAMGTILYEMATQKVAFTGQTLVETVVNITGHRPTPITNFRQDAPPAFVELFDRATSTDPERRLTSIDELRAGLRKALEPKQTYRLNTPVSGLMALPKPAQTVTPTPRTPTPVPGSITAAFNSITEMPKPKADKPKVNVWMIATTALVAIIGVLIGATVF
jgi:serine/threonine protein kinase